MSDYKDRLEKELEYWESRDDVFSLVCEGIAENGDDNALMKAYFDNDSAEFGRLALSAAKGYFKRLAEKHI